MAGRERGRATAVMAGTVALAALAPLVALTSAAPATPAGAPAPFARRADPPPSEPPMSIGSAALRWAIPAHGRWAPVESAAIRPGVLTVTAGGGRCTSNFVFTAGGRSYLGQAAHCAGTGLATETDGCASATRPPGTPVTISARDGSRRTGTLAYSSWFTMQQLREADPATCAYNDFALVELATGDSTQVNPSLPVLGGPTGLRRDGLPAGTPVYGYGGSSGSAGSGGSALGSAGRGGRVGPEAGTSAGDVGAGFGHEIYTASPGVPGESGSAFVDADGAAVGVLTTLNLSAEPVRNGATDLAAALAYASRHGGLGDIELAAGTEPFSVAPAG